MATTRVHHLPADGQRPGRRPGWPLVFGLLCFCVGAAVPAQALPADGTVTSGSASLNTTSNRLDITQSTDKVIIEYSGFSIGAAETVQFFQPSPSAAALNRVVGAEPPLSQIDGQLLANGRIFLISPSGIVFSSTAQVSVHGLIASALGISDTDFLAGNYTFSGSPSASVENWGDINTDAGGHVLLIGPTVENYGTINAPQGSIALAGGSSAYVSTEPDGAILLEVPTPDGLADNYDTLQSDGGRVRMWAGAVSQEGLVSAKNMVGQPWGSDRVELIGQDSVLLSATSTTEAGGASGAADGGLVAIESPDGGVTVDSGGIIDVSCGPAGGNAGGASLNAPLGTVDMGGMIDATAQPGSLNKPVRLSADYVLLQGAINTQGGDVELVGGSIDVPETGGIVNAGTAPITLVSSAGGISVNGVTSNGLVTVQSAEAIYSTGYDSAIVAPEVELNARWFIDGDSWFALDANQLAASVVSGDMVICDNEGGLEICTVGSTSGARITDGGEGDSIEITTIGVLTATDDVVNDGGDMIRLRVIAESQLSPDAPDGSLLVDANVTSTGNGPVELIAGGDMVINGSVSAQENSVDLSAVGTIDVSGSVTIQTGDIYVYTEGGVVTRPGSTIAVSGQGDVEVFAGGGGYLVGPAGEGQLNGQGSVVDLAGSLSTQNGDISIGGDAGVVLQPTAEVWAEAGNFVEILAGSGLYGQELTLSEGALPVGPMGSANVGGSVSAASGDVIVAADWIQMQPTGSITNSGPGDVLLSALMGDAIVTGVAADAHVTVTAGGAILDGGDVAVDIQADTLQLLSVDSTGAGADPLEIDAVTLAAAAESGGVYLHDVSGGLEVGAVRETTGVSVLDGSESDEIYISASSPLTITQDVTNTGGGSVFLRAGGGSPGSDLTLDAYVTVEGAGSVNLFAGGNLYQNTPVATQDGDVRMEAGGLLLVGNQVSTEGGDIVLQGGEIDRGGWWCTIENAGPGNVSLITTEGDLAVTTVGCNGRLLLQSAGAIIGENASGPDAEAPDVELVAGTGIGSPADHLEIDAVRMAASTETGGIWVDDVAGGLELTHVGSTSGARVLRGTPGHDLVITVSSPLVVSALVSNASQGGGVELRAGEIVVQDGAGVATTGGGSILLVADAADATVTGISGSGLVSVQSAGAVVDGGDSAPDVAGPEIELLAADGIGAPADAIETDGGKLAAATQNGGVYLADVGDGLEVATVSGTSGVSALGGSPGKNIVVTVNSPLVVSSAVSNASAGGAIELEAGEVIVQDGGTVVNAGGGDVTIRSTAGDAAVTGVSGLAVVSVQSAAGIVDGGDAATDIVAPDVELVATTGIGSESDRVDVDANRLAATTVTGGVHTQDVAGGLELADVGSTSGVSIQSGAAGDGIDVVALSPLTVSSDVTATGGASIRLSAEGTGPADDLLVDASVFAGGGGTVALLASDQVSVGGGDVDADSGDILLSAAGDVWLQAGSTVGATTTGGVELTADSDADLAGAVLGDPGSAIGNPSAAGAMVLTGADIVLDGTLTGIGSLTIQPSSPATSIGIAGGAGDFPLDESDIAALASGFSSLTIGRADGAHAVAVGPVTFYVPVTIRARAPGGSIAVNGEIVGADGASISIYGSGATTTLNADITTEGSAILIDDGVVLGAPALVTLDATGGGAAPSGADVTITGPVDDAVAGSSALLVNAGTGGAVDLQGAVGATTAPAGLDVTGNVIGVRAVTTTGAQTYAGAGAAPAVVINADLTAGGPLTIRDALTVDLAGGADLSAAGAISISDGVIALNLTGPDGAANVIDADGDESVTLAAVTATDSPDLTVNSEGGIALKAVDIGTGTLTVNVDNDADGAETMRVGAVAAGAVNVAGSGQDDVLRFDGGIVVTDVAVSHAETVDLNADVTAGSISIQNATTVDLAAGVDLMATDGPLSVASGVAGMRLSGAAGSTNVLDSDGDHAITLAAVTATDDANLTVNSEGGLELASADIGAGALVLNVDNDADGAETMTVGPLAAGTIALTGASQDDTLALQGAINGADVLVGNAALVDVNADLTGTSLIVQNASLVDLGADVDLTANGGVLDLSGAVACLSLSGADGTTNVLDGNGDQPVSLPPVTADASPNLTVNSDGGIALSTIDIGGGALALAVDDDDDGAEALTAGALRAGSIAVTGSGQDDTLAFGGPVAGADVLVDNAALVDVNAALTADAGVVVRNALAVNVAADVNAGDGVAFGGPVTFDGPGDQEVDAGAGTLDAQGALTKAAAGDLTLTAHDIQLAGTVADPGGVLTLQPSDPATSIGIAGGAGDFSLDATEVALLSDGFSAIVIGRADGSHVTVVDNVQFTDPVTIRTAAGGSITLDGTLTGADDASVTLIGALASTTANADIVTDANPILIEDVLVLGTPALVTLDTTNGGAFPAGADVTITGSVADDDPVGSPTALAINAGSGGTVSLQDVSTGYSQTYDGLLALHGDLIALGGCILLNGPVTLGTDVAITTSGTPGDITFAGVVDGAQALTLDSALGVLVLRGPVGSVTPLAALSASAGSIDLSAVTVTGDVALVSTAGDVTLTGITGGGVVSVTSAGAVLDGGEDVTDIAASDVELVAATGIGTSGDMLDVDVARMAGASGAGGIYVADVAGDLEIATVGSTTGVSVPGGTADDQVHVTSANALLVTDDVANANGPVQLDAAAAVTVGGGATVQGSGVAIGAPVITVAQGGAVASDSGELRLVGDDLNLAGSLSTQDGDLVFDGVNVTHSGQAVATGGAVAVTADDALTITGTVAAEGGAVDLHGGAVTLTGVSSDTAVSVQSAGSIQDAGDEATDVAAPQVELTAGTGIGLAEDALEIDAVLVAAVTDEGGIYLVDVSNGLEVGEVGETMGVAVLGGVEGDDISIVVSSPLTVSAPVSNLAAGGDVWLSAGSLLSIGAAVSTDSGAIGMEAGELSVLDGGSVANGGVGSILLTTSAGDAVIARISGGGLATIQSAAAIRDGAETETDVVAPDIEFIAESGIAEEADYMEIDGERLAATTQSGGIYIEDVAGGLEVTSVGSTSGASILGVTAGDIYLAAFSPLTITEDVQNLSGGGIILAAQGTAAGDDLSIGGNVVAVGDAGSIQLFAGSDILHTGGVSTQGGNILMTAGDMISLSGTVGTGAGSVFAQAGQGVNVGGSIGTQGGSVLLRANGVVAVSGSLRTQGGSITVISSAFDATGGTIDTGGGSFIISFLLPTAFTVGSRADFIADLEALLAGEAGMGQEEEEERKEEEGAAEAEAAALLPAHPAGESRPAL